MTASINDVRSELKIFPNPTSDIINIFSSDQRLLEIKIVDITGKDIFSLNIFGSTDLDLSALQSGIYFLSIIDGEKQYTEKIIKK